MKKRNGCLTGCLSVIVLFFAILVIAYACSGGGNNSNDEEQKAEEVAEEVENGDSNSEVADYIKKANAFYAESGAFIQAFSENTDADNYEENRQKLMTETSELNERVGAELDKIPEDTTDEGLKLARQALDIDSKICMALYATLATNDPSGADMITQYVQQYNDLKPELDKYV